MPSYLEQAQTAWANAVDAETKLRQGKLTPGQQEFAESFVPRAKQDAATLAGLAQAEALVRIADSLDALIVALQSGQIARNLAFPPDHIDFVARKPRHDKD